MPIVTRCPKCNQAYNLADEAVGRQAKCKCGHRFIVVKAEEPPATPAPPERPAVSAMSPVPVAVRPIASSSASVARRKTIWRWIALAMVSALLIVGVSLAVSLFGRGHKPSAGALEKQAAKRLTDYAAVSKRLSEGRTQLLEAGARQGRVDPGQFVSVDDYLRKAELELFNAKDVGVSDEAYRLTIDKAVEYFPECRVQVAALLSRWGEAEIAAIHAASSAEAMADELASLTAGKLEEGDIQGYFGASDQPIANRLRRISRLQSALYDMRSYDAPTAERLLQQVPPRELPADQVRQYRLAAQRQALEPAARRFEGVDQSPTAVFITTRPEMELFVDIIDEPGPAPGVERLFNAALKAELSASVPTGPYMWYPLVRAAARHPGEFLQPLLDKAPGNAHLTIALNAFVTPVDAKINTMSIPRAAISFADVDKPKIQAAVMGILVAKMAANAAQYNFEALATGGPDVRGGKLDAWLQANWRGGSADLVEFLLQTTISRKPEEDEPAFAQAWFYAQRNYLGMSWNSYPGNGQELLSNYVQKHPQGRHAQAATQWLDAYKRWLDRPRN